MKDGKRSNPSLKEEKTNKDEHKNDTRHTNNQFHIEHIEKRQRKYSEEIEEVFSPGVRRAEGFSTEVKVFSNYFFVNNVRVLVF